MSHIPQRKEKDCLNCGAIVQGHYCHNCGQENVVPKETFWHMVTHFFYDITHFDSSFFTTIKDLFFKPGFLSGEYMKGRRASYLHPIRLYVFTSAIFFLLFFSFFVSENEISIDLNQPLTEKERTNYIRELEQRMKKDTGNKWVKERILFARDTIHPITAADVMKGETGDNFSLSFTDTKHRTLEEYDSVQKTLSPSKRDGWMMRRLVKMDINLKQKFSENPLEATKRFTDSLLHRLPYMLLISLPFFALILKIVYIRRKQFYYADHGVFTIHLYVFTFLLLLLVFSTEKLSRMTGIEDLEYFIFLLTLLLFFYLYKAMRTFYGQRRAKTFIKFLLVAFLSIIMMLILFLLFMFFSAATL
ncbi:MAG: DUF3667 domain-containing protein [Bacteroidota bacterium]